MARIDAIRVTDIHAAEAVRAILDEVEEQRLRPQSPPKRVGKTRATYGTGFARPIARWWPEPGVRHGQLQTLQ